MGYERKRIYKEQKQTLINQDFGGERVLGLVAIDAGGGKFYLGWTKSYRRPLVRAGPVRFWMQ